MAFWDALRSNTGTWNGTDWNPTPGPNQRNDYSIPLYVGTPIESPVSGIVLPEHTNGGGVYSYYGKMDWGGEVDVLTFLPKYGGLVDVNMLHFDTINVKPGDVVSKGTVLGTSGGQNSGGNMPSIPRFSSGPHIGVGVHAVDNWDRMYDPKPLLGDLLAGQDTSSVPAQTQIQGSGLGWLPRGSVVAGNPLTGPLQSGHGNTDPPNARAPQSSNTPSNCDTPIIGGIWCQIQTWFGGLWNGPEAFGWRSLKLLLGLGLFSTGIVLFVAGSLGGDIAAAAVTAAGMPEAAPFASAAVRGRGGPVRSIGNAIRTRGAIAGQKTLNERQERGKSEGRKEVIQLIKEQRHEAAMKGVATKRRKKAEAAPPAPAAAAPDVSDLGEPVYMNLGEGNQPKRGPLVGYERNGVLYNPEGLELGSFEQSMSLPPGMIPGTPEYEARQRKLREMRGQLGYKEES